MQPQALAACFAVATLLCQPALAENDPKLLEEARFVAKSLPPKLTDFIQRVIQQHGPAEALTQYSHLSPKVLADATDETGWQIRQVSLRNRSPRAKPDPFETEVLMLFEKRLAAGEPAITIDLGLIVTEGGKRYYRYLQPLMTQSVCLECHGPAETLKPEVRERLKELYPHDRATGYTIGTMRGALSLKKPL